MESRDPESGSEATRTRTRTRTGQDQNQNQDQNTSRSLAWELQLLPGGGEGVLAGSLQMMEEVGGVRPDESQFFQGKPEVQRSAGG